MVGFRNYRDVSLIQLNQKELMVIACDSLGGIGPKPADKIKVPAEIIGIYTSRVPLMEVLAVGAEPITLINTLSVEMEPTGIEILKGIKKELNSLGLKESILINGSTEENIETVQTGIGVTVVGKVLKSNLKLGTSKKGDLIALIGTPRVGPEVLKGNNVNLNLVKELLKIPWINEILPVGSKGIKYEALQLARGVEANLNFLSGLEIDLEKSAGPSTCLLVTLNEKYFLEIKNRLNLPIFKIAYLV